MGDMTKLIAEMEAQLVTAGRLCDDAFAYFELAEGVCNVTGEAYDLIASKLDDVMRYASCLAL